MMADDHWRRDGISVCFPEKLLEDIAKLNCSCRTGCTTHGGRATPHGAATVRGRVRFDQFTSSAVRLLLLSCARETHSV